MLSKFLRSSNQRSQMFSILALSIFSIATLTCTYYYFFLSSYVSTDNAYVGADMAQVAAYTGGVVKEIKFKDTDIVKKGDVLVILDDIDAKLLLKRANAEFSKAKADLERTKIDLSRRSKIAKSGSVSLEEISNAKTANALAEAALKAAESNLSQAQVDYERTVIKSPINGITSKRQVQLGQRVQVGTLLTAIVPTDNLYVNANFKETQLRNVKIGQTVKLISDLYGKDVVFNGKVVGFSGGTGAAFAVIPAQNATGNWIKVVQRLPVRIELDVNQLKENPLKVGLSMNVDINIKSLKS